MFRWIFGLLFVLVGFAAQADPVLNSAILPNGRVIPKGTTATLFMTTTNSGDMDASNCQVVVSNTIGQQDVSKIDVAWALTDAAGDVIGNQNDPFAIVAGGSARLVLGITQNASAGPFDNRFQAIMHVECDGGFGSLGWPAVNGADIFFDDIRDDIIPIIQTVSMDGIANVDGDNRLAALSVAAINLTALSAASSKGKSGPHAGETSVGIGGRYTGYRSAGQFDYFACETDASGACVTEMSTCSPGFQPCFSAEIGDVPKTFSFFVHVPEGQGAPFQPQAYRFEPTFHDQFDSAMTSSSVALNSPTPLHNGDQPLGQYDFVARNTNDLGARTLRTGILQFGTDFVSGILFRNIDRGAFIQVVPQDFQATGTFAEAEADGGNDCSQSTPCNEPMWANLTWTFYNTELGAESDGVVTDGTCTIYPEKGGTCTFLDAPGEQVVGEPDFYDALEDGSLVAGNDFSSRISADQFLAKNLLSAANENFVFDTDIEQVAGAPNFKLDGCQFFNILPRIAPNSDKVVTALLVLGECDPGSPLESIAGITFASNVFLNQRLADGSCIYQFVVVLDPLDPNSKTYTFYVKTEPPAAETPQSQSTRPTSMHPAAQSLANQHNKPVYWWINGKNVLVARPEAD